MPIPTYTVEDLTDVPRLPEKIQLISDPVLPVFFFVVGGGSRFFFINLRKFIDPVTNKIASEATEASGGAGVLFVSFGSGDELFVVPT